MGTQYNSFDPVFPDKKTMENSEYANSAKVSSCLAHPIECATDQLALTELYVRNGGIPTGADVRLYDLGRFSYAVGGQSASDVAIGELWCTYEVELYFPRLTTAFSNVNNYCALNSTAIIANGSTPLGNSAIRGTSNTFQVGVGGNQNVIFPQECIGQSFLVSYIVLGTAAVITAPILSSPGGVTITYNPLGANLGSPTNGVNSAALVMNFIITVSTNSAPTLTFQNAGTIPTNSQWILYMVQIPAGALVDDEEETPEPGDTPDSNDTLSLENIEHILELLSRQDDDLVLSSLSKYRKKKRLSTAYG